MSSDEHLTKMANDIADFFRAEPLREDAIGGIVNHILKYWTRRMREKLIEHLRGDTAGFDDLTLEAVRRVAAQMAAKDAGTASA